MINKLIYLGIETSCDDTGISIFNNQKKIISEYILTQKIHHAYGGTVPELAARDHLKHTFKLILYILKKSKLKINDLNCIAYTKGPGLKGALFIGISLAKTLSLLLKIPSIGINHLEAHILINFAFDSNFKFPSLVLLVSGAHTIMLKMTKHHIFKIIGESADDGVGESFDKVARSLKLIPANGVSIEKKMPYKFIYKNMQFLKNRKNIKHYNFSFSGIKSEILKIQNKYTETNSKNIIYNFQNTITNTFTSKIRTLLSTDNTFKNIILGGGVSANKELRIAMKNISEEFHITFKTLPKKYCTDNGSMIAFLGFIKMNNGFFDNTLNITAFPTLRLLL